MRYLRAFLSAFWRAYELERLKHAIAQDPVVTQPGPGVEPAIEPLRLVAPAPRSWPDEHEWLNVVVDCEGCGESVIQVTSAWLLEHAGVGALVCPFCNVPTDQAVTYDVTA